MRRTVLNFGEALHAHLEKAMTKRATPTNAFLEEAKRLRMETTARERQDFGKKTAPAVTDNGDRDAGQALYMGGDSDDTTHSDWMPTSSMSPDVTMQLNQVGSSLTGMSIMEEITEDRLHGKLRPFIEGEPIGCIQHWPRDSAPMLKTEVDLYNDRQKVMLELRAKNDAAMDAFLRR